MKKSKHAAQRALSLLTALALTLSLVTLPAFAAGEEPTTPKGSFINTSADGGEHQINLSSPRTFKAMIPVDMTETEAAEAAKTVVWSLIPDEGKEYLDPALYPNHTEGGPLDSWLCQDGTTPFFTDVVTSVETAEGQVYLTVTFATGIYFYTSSKNQAGETVWTPDYSVPHANGGFYMDLCGYYDLTALLDGQALGAAPLKISPYDNFHTMAEIYAEIDEMVAFAAEHTDLYVVKGSMGQSQGDNGLAPLDMPYLIVAGSKAAVDKWQTIKTQAERDPSALIQSIQNGSLGDYQVPVLYSNVHANEVSASDGVVKFTWMLLEAAAADGKLDYDKLTGFTPAGETALKEQLGPQGREGSVAVPDLVKDSATYLGYLKGESAPNSGVVDLEQYYTMETETVDVDDLLDNVFFLIVPEENVEGRTYLTRTSSGGFDLNRDNSFQTQAETQNMTRFIAAWNPVSFVEFHGRVKSFQCEPCDPPHEPNFEYDLLAEHLMTGGEALGIAAVANNGGYNSYIIPQRDYLTYTGAKTADGADETRWLDPWDDMSTSYTPQYAMLHGTVSYTVEVPAYNDYTATAVAYGQLGQSHYIAEHKESYLLAQTKILERGVTNANSNAYELVGQWFCDQYDVEGAEAGLFRPEYDGEGQNGNFYPECYIIPLDGDNQSNLQAADEMLEYLTRNGVKVQTVSQPFHYQGVTYPAGTAVVSMYQAKRSVANGVLYDGTVITEWPVLYSEGITAFNKTRGFDMATCAEPAAYELIAAVLSDAPWDVSSSFRAKGHIMSIADDIQIVLMNSSEDSTAAVNTLLQAGKKVSLITEGEYKGSFLCTMGDYRTVADQYLLNANWAPDQLPTSTVISKAPVVYISGRPADNTSGFVKSTLVSGAYEYNYDRQAMELLGFTVTDDPSKADLIIGAAALDDRALAAVKSGTAYIGYGRRAIPGAAALFPAGALVRNTVSSESMDALTYVTYPTESLITASYSAEGDDILYGYGAGYFAAIPDGAQVLVRIDGTKAPLEGFLCSTGEHYQDFLNNSIQAISYQGRGVDGGDLNVVLFANTLTNKVHQRDEFNFISNAAFAAVLEEGAAVPAAGTAFSDVSESDWFSSAVAEVTATGLMSGLTETTFGPAFPTDRATLVAALWRLAGSPDAETADFSDVTGNVWYAGAVNWAVSSGITSGSGEGTFSPNAPVTREQLAVFFRQTADAQGLEISNSGVDLNTYEDGASVSPWAADAMAWAVSEGVLSGKPNNLLAPGDVASRAETAAILLRFQEKLDDAGLSA